VGVLQDHFVNREKYQKSGWRSEASRFSFDKIEATLTVTFQFCSAALLHSSVALLSLPEPGTL
jgi:hypothetical protein